MTVGEMIKELQAYNPSMQVAVTIDSGTGKELHWPVVLSSHIPAPACTYISFKCDF